jgi:hypothetical protein
MSRHTMRGVGPTVALSHASADRAEATLLSDELHRGGCRVWLEDETAQASATPAPEVDVFVQLRNVRSNASSFLNGRFEEAVRRRERCSEFVMIPVALNRAALTGPFAEWVHVDASAGLSAVMNLISRTAMTALHVAPLQPGNPFVFEPEALARVLDQVPRDGKRIVTDSDDVIGGTARKIMEWLGAAEPSRRDPLEQQRKFVARAEEYMRSVDAVMLVLVRQLHRLHEGYSAYNLEYAKSAPRSLERFSRLALWRFVSRLADWGDCLDERERAEICAPVDDAREKIAAVSPSDEGLGLATWALGPSATYNCAEFVEVEAVAPGKPSMRWYLPRTMLGSHWSMLGARPDTEIWDGVWLDCVLPQVAYRALLTADATTREDPVRLETAFAWNLADYTHMGAP